MKSAMWVVISWGNCIVVVVIVVGLCIHLVMQNYFNFGATDAMHVLAALPVARTFGAECHRRGMWLGPAGSDDMGAGNVLATRRR